MGVALGAIGLALPPRFRVTLALVAAVAAVVIGLRDIIMPTTKVCGRSAETPQRWMHYGPLLWAFSNGLVLGSGLATRVGFWLWYVLPTAALLSGNPLLAGLIFGSYGFTRGAAPLLLISTARLSARSLEQLSDLLTLRYGWARGRTSSLLLSMGMAVGITISSSGMPG